MTTSRRFFSQAALFGGVVSAVGENLFANQVSLTGSPADDDVVRFWTKEAHPVKAIRKGSTPGPTYLREPLIMYADPSGNLQLAHKLDDRGMPKTGDVEVTIDILRFRPSEADAAAFEKFEAGTLRL